MTRNELQKMQAAFYQVAYSGRIPEGDAHKPLLKLWEAAWHSALFVGSEEQKALEKVYEHAYGLTFGMDWNKGTAAGNHRDKLVEAVKVVRSLRGD